MKSLSASIIVAAGVLAFTVGGFVQSGVQNAVMMGGALVAMIGLIGWFFSLGGPAERHEKRDL
jgi:hypothetical protein